MVAVERYGGCGGTLQECWYLMTLVADGGSGSLYMWVATMVVVM